MRVNTTVSHLGSGCGFFGSFACGVPWSLASFGLFNSFETLFGLSFSCRACSCGGTFAFAFFFFFGAFASRLLPLSAFLGAVFSSCSSSWVVVSLFDSTASLFRLVEFVPRPSSFFLVLLVSLVATRPSMRVGLRAISSSATRRMLFGFLLAKRAVAVKVCASLASPSLSVFVP